MPYRPETTTQGGKWLGFQDAQIVDFRDKSDQYDWADVYLEVDFRIPTSEYPVTYQLKGSYEKNDDGTIKDNSLLRRIYYLFDAIEFRGGPNRYGEWVDENDAPINNIVAFLNKHYIEPDALTSNAHPFYIYVYKEAAKDGKAYTRVAQKIARQVAREKVDLESWITFMKSKGFIKEATESTSNSGPSNSQRTSF